MVQAHVGKRPVRYRKRQGDSELHVAAGRLDARIQPECGLVAERSRLVGWDLPEELDRPRVKLRQVALKPAEPHVAALGRRSRHGGKLYGRRRRENRRRPASYAPSKHILARRVRVKRNVASLVLVASTVVVRRHGVRQAACRRCTGPVGHARKPIERKCAFVELRKRGASRDQNTSHHQSLHVITSLSLLQSSLRGRERLHLNSARVLPRSRRQCARCRRWHRSTGL